ncbi:IF2 family translation initiation factor [Mycolicibacterium sp. XJ1819]
MNITDIPFAVLRFQYSLARFPLQVIGHQLAARMDDEAPARLFYERSLGVLDATVGNALGDEQVERRGAALIERSDALRRAARLDAEATSTIKAAGSEVNQTREEAKQRQQSAREAKKQEVQQAREDTQKRKRAAVETAQKRIATGQKRADGVAARRKDDVDAVKRSEQAGIRAAEQAAAAQADAELEDASRKRVAAAGKRAQADRVEDLAEAEKQKRRGSNGS